MCNTMQHAATQCNTGSDSVAHVQPRHDSHGSKSDRIHQVHCLALPPGSSPFLSISHSLWRVFGGMSSKVVSRKMVMKQISSPNKDPCYALMKNTIYAVPIMVAVLDSSFADVYMGMTDTGNHATSPRNHMLASTRK